MLDFMKRRNRPTSPPQMTYEQGQRAAIKLDQLMKGVGCLYSNIGVHGQDLAIRLANGDISEADLSEVINVMHNAHDDLERACRQVSKAREMVAPPAEAH